MRNYLRNFLDPTFSHIDIYDNNIYITNYDKIITIATNKVIIKMTTKKIILEGKDFYLNKLADKELLVSGKLQNLEIKYE